MSLDYGNSTTYEAGPRTHREAIKRTTTLLSAARRPLAKSTITTHCQLKQPHPHKQTVQTESDMCTAKCAVVGRCIKNSISEKYPHGPPSACTATPDPRRSPALPQDWRRVVHRETITHTHTDPQCIVTANGWTHCAGSVRHRDCGSTLLSSRWPNVSTQ